MKNAYDLLCKMAQAPIEYGLWNKVDQKPLTGKDFEKVNNTNEISDKCIVMKPEDVWARKLGTCWDCTLLEYVELKKMGYKELIPVYFEQFPKNSYKEYTTTHSFIVYTEPKVKGYFWFEYTWYKQCGLHGPWNTMKELKERVEEAATVGGKDVIRYWKEGFDIEALLSMDEIGIMDFVKIVNPKSVEG